MPRLTAVEIKQMRVEILTEAFSLREIGRHFGVSVQTVFRHKKELKQNPSLRAKFQKQLNKIMLERDAKVNEGKSLVNKRLIESDESDNSALREVSREIENVTVERAANMVADVIEKHRQITQDAMTGVKRIQDAINTHAEVHHDDPDMVRGLAQAQRQNTSSIVNIINSDRRSYNIDDPSAGDDAPDAVQITFYRDNAPPKIENAG